MNSTFKLHTIRTTVPLLLGLFILPCAANDDKIDDPTDTSISCSYLVITPDSLEESAARLVSYRGKRFPVGGPNGSTNYFEVPSKYITISTIFSLFIPSDTVPACLAISRMLRYACMNWTIKPGCVVLLGDDRFENYPIPPDKNSGSRVPTFWNPKVPLQNTNKNIPDSLKVYSDHFYCYAPVTQEVYDHDANFDILYNRLPLFTVGRIPCENNMQGNLYIDKLQMFENNRRTGAENNTVVYLADNMFSSAEKDFDITYIEDCAEEGMAGWFTAKVYSSNYMLDNHQSSGIARGA